MSRKVLSVLLALFFCPRDGVRAGEGGSNFDVVVGYSYLPTLPSTLAVTVFSIFTRRQRFGCLQIHWQRRADIGGYRPITVTRVPESTDPVYLSIFGPRFSYRRLSLHSVHNRSRCAHTGGRVFGTSSTSTAFAALLWSALT